MHETLLSMVCTMTRHEKSSNSWWSDKRISKLHLSLTAHDEYWTPLNPEFQSGHHSILLRQFNQHLLSWVVAAVSQSPW
jgi:hypothetical protein